MLDQSTIDYLHDYSKKFRFNIDGKMEQREISGKLVLYETSPDTFLVKVDEESSNLGGKEQTTSMNMMMSCSLER
jgi:hypothetical protein